MRNCDQCDGTEYTEENPRVFMCQRRPSDPSEMCSVLAGHKNCYRITDPLPQISESGGIATAEQWNDWIESPEAQKMGFIFLSL